jgi:hypothetical protein
MDNRHTYYFIRPNGECYGSENQEPLDRLGDYPLIILGGNQPVRVAGPAGGVGCAVRRQRCAISPHGPTDLSVSALRIRFSLPRGGRRNLFPEALAGR